MLNHQAILSLKRATFFPENFKTLLALHDKQTLPHVDTEVTFTYLLRHPTLPCIDCLAHKKSNNNISNLL